ncbi:MAG: hypothetical protein WBM68_09730 [Woeseia sp.]
MSRKVVSRTLSGLAVCALLVPALFEVSFDPQFALPAEVQVAEPRQEARFEECLTQRDAFIHETAFSTIDNPDVQREFISTERDKARAECRASFPEHLQTEHLPLRIKLVDLKFRY